VTNDDRNALARMRAGEDARDPEACLDSAHRSREGDEFNQVCAVQPCHTAQFAACIRVVLREIERHGVCRFDQTDVYWLKQLVARLEGDL
jgi:hypothetical protein